MVTKNNLQNSGKWIQPLAILQGIVAAFVFLIIISIILAITVHFSTWQPTSKLLNVLAYIVVFAGALWSGQRCSRRAWLHGIVVGFGVVVILSFMVLGEGVFVTWLWWKKTILICFLAMLGGIVGGLFN